MVWAPPGQGRVGADGAERSEAPATSVNMPGFWIGKYEVTQALYQAVMGRNPVDRDSVSPLAPVTSVSWHDAMEFCRRLSQTTGKTYRLPTEAEWEYACRAGSDGNLPFPTGDLGNHAWFGRNSGRRSHPVGQKNANKWGIYDMFGNAWEWTLSLYRPYPYDA